MVFQPEVVADNILNMVEKKGQAQGEVFLLNSRDTTVEVADEKVENLKIAEEQGLGLRVIVNQRLGYAYTSDFSHIALQRLVEAAFNNAQQTQADEGWHLTKPQAKYPQLELIDEKISEITLEEKINNALIMEQAAREYDSRVKITEKTVFNDANYEIAIYNNLGLALKYAGNYCGGYALVVGQEKEDSQTGFGMQYKMKYGDFDPRKIGREAGEKAVRMLGAKTINSATMPVVLDPHTATSFLGVLQSIFSGDAVLKGKSFLQGKEGKQVSSPLVTIVDDGVMPGELGSSPFDGEGIPTSRTALIKDGMLQGFLHNSYTAQKMGVESTGNSVRSSYKSTPEVGITNFYIQQGSMTVSELLQDITRGFYITDVMGMHTANPISGNFSVGASGFLIEQGQLTQPVKGVAIAGNLQEFLLNIDAAADDLTFFVGKGAPTLRLKKMNVSGA